MRRIKPSELPEVLTPEIIDILVDMAREEQGRNIEWRVIAGRLNERNELDFILEKAYSRKRIKPEELPDVLTPDIIDSLAYMNDEHPISNNYRQILPKLSEEDRDKIRERTVEIQRERSRARRAALTPEERKKEDDTWQRMLDNPFEYYGNMGRPENKEEWERFIEMHAEWEKKNKK